MVETRGGRRFAILFLAAAFLLLLLGRWIRPVDDAALTVSAPFASAINGVATGVGDTVSSVFEGPSLAQENKRLRRALGQALSQNVTLQLQVKDDQALRRIVKFQSNYRGPDYLLGSVIAVSSDPVDPYVIINKGRRDGLRKGMTVVDQNGYFVGSIYDVVSDAAKVQLMVNPSSSVGVVDLQSHAAGMVEGEFGGKAAVKDVPTKASMHPGDLIVTSGLLGMYPRGLVVGQVARVTRNSVSIFQSADLRPAADLQGLEIVQIIRNFHPSDAVKLVTAP